MECPDWRAIEASCKKGHLKLASKDASDGTDGLLSESALDSLGPEPWGGFDGAVTCPTWRGWRGWRGGGSFSSSTSRKEGLCEPLACPCNTDPVGLGKSERNNKCVLTLQAMEPWS